MKQAIMPIADTMVSFISFTRSSRDACTIDTNKAAGRAKSSTTLLNFFASSPEKTPFLPEIKPTSITTIIGTMAYNIT